MKRNRLQRRVRKQKDPKYKKKNTESNISNQIFSFLNSKNKSKFLLVKILSNLNIPVKRASDCFYEYMKAFKKGKSKYMNKKIIGELSVASKNSALFHVLLEENALDESLSL